MKIGIAGYGFVGQAHTAVLETKHEMLVSDPNLGYTDDLSQSDAIIICVSTPKGAAGHCHMDNVISVIARAPNVPILIKSTISLEGWKVIRHLFNNHDLTFSPEFLRASSALEDFANAKEILIGGDSVSFWSDTFKDVMDVEIKVSEPEELIMVKYFRNAFLATKVAFFNEIYDLCEVARIDYKEVASMIGDDPRIGHSHTEVTEERGFGGHCFPKDVSAIISTARQYKSPLEVLQAAEAYNKEIRK